MFTSKIKRLKDAISKGDLSAVQELVRQGVDVNHVHKTGHTPLHLAVFSGFVVGAEELIKAGAEVDAVGISIPGVTENDPTKSGGWTPLYTAVECRQADVARVLLQRGANANAGAARFRPLRAALRLEHVELVKLLLQHGADINKLAESGKKYLDDVVLSEDPATPATLQIMQALITAGASLDDSVHATIEQLAGQLTNDQATKFMAAIQWIKQRIYGMKELTDLPFDVFQKGPFEVQQLFEAVQDKLDGSSDKSSSKASAAGPIDRKGRGGDVAAVLVSEQTQVPSSKISKPVDVAKDAVRQPATVDS